MTVAIISFDCHDKRTRSTLSFLSAAFRAVAMSWARDSGVVAIHGPVQVDILGAFRRLGDSPSTADSSLNGGWTPAGISRCG
jgi:hypothetical protein